MMTISRLAFVEAMKGRHYGVEETEDALAWFNTGWKSAHEEAAKLCDMQAAVAKKHCEDASKKGDAVTWASWKAIELAQEHLAIALRQGVEPPAVIAVEDAAIEFRESLVPRADLHERGVYPAWHGWALYEAFIAGAAWARRAFLGEAGGKKT